MVLRLLIVFLLASVFSGCGSRQAIPYPDYDGLSKGFKAQSVISGPLPVYGWFPEHSSRSKESVVRIYIEGDGRGWIRRGRPALDSTPQNRLVQYLVQFDDKADVAYLGRPCQFVQGSGCEAKVWTFDRYHQYIVDVMSRAVDKVKVRGGYQQVEFVGYSGGGTVALLLAAQRNDVVSVRTVAGNLDPVYTNELHAVSEMPGALVPSHYREQLASIPQVHFYGQKDPVVPASVSEHYLEAFKNKSCIQRQAVDADHRSNWAESWSELLMVKPECRNSAEK